MFGAFTLSGRWESLLRTFMCGSLWRAKVWFSWFTMSWQTLPFHAFNTRSSWQVWVTSWLTNGAPNLADVGWVDCSQVTVLYFFLILLYLLRSAFMPRMEIICPKTSCPWNLSQDSRGMTSDPVMAISRWLSNDFSRLMLVIRMQHYRGTQWALPGKWQNLSNLLSISMGHLYTTYLIGFGRMK